MRFVSKSLAGCLAAAFVAFALAPTAFGAAYQIDSSLSTITIGGNVKATGVPTVGTVNFSKLTAQSGVSATSPNNANSNKLTLAGQIHADNTGSALNFNGGVITAIDHPLIAPNVGGTAHTPFAPGAVGLRGNATVLFVVQLTLQAALRDLQLGIDGSAPLTGNNFALGGLSLGIDQATLAYYVSSSVLNQGGSTTVSNESAPFTGTGSGSLVGDVLTIPVSISLPITEGEAPDIVITSTLTFNGTIVARLIPEPGTIAMLGMGVVGLAVVGRRKFRKHANR
jgi:hypothetical protein